MQTPPVKQFWYIGYPGGRRVYVQGNSMHDPPTSTPDFKTKEDAERRARYYNDVSVYRCDVYKETE
jgi:hypothetical protein